MIMSGPEGPRSQQNAKPPSDTVTGGTINSRSICRPAYDPSVFNHPRGKETD
jgi:hypothetical protein